MTLRTRLLLQIFLPLFLLVTVMMWLALGELENVLSHRLEKEIELVARAMQMPVQQAVRSGDGRRVAEALDAVFEIDRVYGAYVYDAEGRRMAVAGEALPGPREQLEAVEVVAGGQPLGRYAELAGEDVFSYFVPLLAPSGQIDGLLQVVRRESDMRAWLSRVRWWGWLGWIAAVSLLVLILILGHRRSVLRPVEQLLSSMHKVESGQRDHRAAVQAPRELGMLASGLNRMLDGLDRMQQQIDRQQHEALALQERLRAQENLAALGRFSAGVAHELGAPLSVIDADARGLERQTDLPPESGRRIARMREQVKRTRLLLSQLMEFVRSDQQPTAAVPVGALLKQALAAARPQLEACSIQAELTHSEPALTIKGHRVRLEHALLNLLRNAISAASSQVLLSAEAKSGHISIAVEDDGPGVPAADAERIFEPFFTGKREAGGTGLGLAIVRSVANEHAAEIRVGRSPVLGGGRFELIFGDAS